LIAFFQSIIKNDDDDDDALKGITHAHEACTKKLVPETCIA